MNTVFRNRDAAGGRTVGNRHQLQEGTDAVYVRHLYHHIIDAGILVYVTDIYIAGNRLAHQLRLAAVTPIYTEGIRPGPAGQLQGPG